MPAAAVIATRSEVYPDSGDALGWRLGADGFRIVLTADLADVVERRLSGSVTAFLAEHGLTVDDIGSWICHPGGPKVIDAVQQSLKLPDSALALPAAAPWPRSATCPRSRCCTSWSRPSQRPAARVRSA